MKNLSLRLALAALLILLAVIVRAGDAPKMGVASNFGQGWQPDMMRAATDLGVTDFRDAVYWREVERGGHYVFKGKRQVWPELLPDIGAGMSLTVNNGHPDWDGGHTPLSPDAVAAFAAFAAATVARFPAIHTVEVGNEMNSDTFVSGPGWDTDLAKRAQSYTALLAETARAVRATRPDTRILGGAAHSIPLYWFDALFSAGAAAHMDALVIHPYGIQPEQLRRQIDQLRGLPDAADMPIEVTEFGQTDPEIAPAHLLKNYCQMALAGVERVIWYPLNPRGDGLVPLIGQDGEVTAVGEAYRFIDDVLAAGEVTDASPDPFTYACRFGTNRLVIWGETRAVSVDADVSAFDARGHSVPADGLALDMERPLVLVATGDVMEAVQLGPQRIIADSVHQFSYDGADDPFDRRVASASDDSALEARPGQEKNGVPWRPYLGTGWDGILRAGADWVLPSAPSAGPLDVVYRYAPGERLTADLFIEIAPSERSEDGVDLTVRLAGEDLLRERITGPRRIGPLPVSFKRRHALEVRVGPGETARGDVTKLRVVLRQPEGSDQ